MCLKHVGTLKVYNFFIVDSQIIIIIIIAAGAFKNNHITRTNLETIKYLSSYKIKPDKK